MFWLKFFDVLFKLNFIKLRFEHFLKAIKSVWWMPWLSEAMKDVVSCDKLRGGANNF